MVKYKLIVQSTAGQLISMRRFYSRSLILIMSHLYTGKNVHIPTIVMIYRGSINVLRPGHSKRSVIPCIWVSDVSTRELASWNRTGRTGNLYKPSRSSHYIFLQYRIAIYYCGAKSFRPGRCTYRVSRYEPRLSFSSLPIV